MHVKRKLRFFLKSNRLVPLGAPACAAAALLWAVLAPTASARVLTSDVAAAAPSPRTASALSAALVRLESIAVGDTASRSTADGVYTIAQANLGRDIFAGACQSCHTPTVHAGPPFRGKWFGRTLGDLFGYLRREMPQTDPGSLSDEEYSLVIAYLLRINRMPAGDSALAGDSTSLHRIRLDSLPGPRT